jgi:predicted DNA-binding transcriptional regulator YafY
MPQKIAPPAQLSRPPLERMMHIHEEFQDGHLTNCTKLAELLEVSTKTVMRDIAFMRDRLHLPIEYDEKLYAYRYAYPVKTFPTVQISEGELLALLVAEKALKEYAGTPYHAQLSHAFEKLTAALRSKVTFAPEHLNTVSFHHTGIGRADLKVFDRLSHALHESREIEFDYVKPGSKAVETRRVRPYHLANRDNFWYLVAFDVGRKALRHFAVARMRDVQVRELTFTVPEDFDPELHFAKSFGAFVGTGDHKVVVRFTPTVADRVRERVWHRSQVERNRADGSLELTLRVDNLDEVERWVLGWGEHVEVLAPRELAERVQRTAVRVVGVYRGRG